LIIYLYFSGNKTKKNHTDEQWSRVRKLTIRKKEERNKRKKNKKRRRLSKDNLFKGIAVGSLGSSCYSAYSRYRNDIAPSRSRVATAVAWNKPAKSTSSDWQSSSCYRRRGFPRILCCRSRILLNMFFRHQQNRVCTCIVLDCRTFCTRHFCDNQPGSKDQLHLCTFLRLTPCIHKYASQLPSSSCRSCKWDRDSLSCARVRCRTDRDLFLCTSHRQLCTQACTGIRSKVPFWLQCTLVFWNRVLELCCMPFLQRLQANWTRTGTILLPSFGTLQPKT